MEKRKNRLLTLLRELVIVAVGVAFALLGENYVEYLNERSLEKLYLTELLEELVVSREYLADDRERYHQTDSAALGLIEMSSSGKIGSYTPCDLIRVVCQMIEPDVYSSVYEDIKFSGNLKLILNRKLRSRIINYYQRQVYEERWARDQKEVLFNPYQRDLIDLLSVQEYDNPDICRSQEILSRLKAGELLDVLKRARKYARSNGQQLEGRMSHNDWVVGLLREELSRLGVDSRKNKEE